MTDERMTEDEFHKKMAIETNNGIWPVLDKESPSMDELEEVLHMAHTSLYHWSKIGKPINIARAQYMIARVTSAMGMAEPSLYHAKRCLEITKETGIGDFDLAFAYEVMSRAYALMKDRESFDKYMQKAKKAIDDVKGNQDRAICVGELSEVKYQ